MEVSTDTEIIYSTKGVIKVRLKAPLMTRYVGEKPYIEMEKGINLTFFDTDLTVKSNLTANYAISKDAEQTYEAKDDVVLINKQGDTLNTEHLVWDSNKEIVYSKEFVKITTPKQIIMGHGFESNQDFTKYHMKKVTATISVNKDGESF